MSTTTMAADIFHSADYPYPPELVWRAVATREGLDAWMMVNDFGKAEVGHKFRFTDRPRPFWDGICDCEVIEADAPRKFTLRWGINQKGEATVASWSLTPTAGGGTHLEFRHSGLKGFMGTMMRLGMNRGWQRMITTSIPFVAAGMAKGRTPTREEVREVFKKA